MFWMARSEASAFLVVMYGSGDGGGVCSVSSTVANSTGSALVSTPPLCVGVGEGRQQTSRKQTKMPTVRRGRRGESAAHSTTNRCLRSRLAGEQRMLMA